MGVEIGGGEWRENDPARAQAMAEASKKRIESSRAAAAAGDYAEAARIRGEAWTEEANAGSEYDAQNGILRKGAMPGDKAEATFEVMDESGEEK